MCRKGFIKFAVRIEYDEGKLAEGPKWCEIGGTILVGCGWYNVWEGPAVALKLVLVWIWLLFIQLNELLWTIIERAEGRLGNPGIAVLNVFSMINLSFYRIIRFVLVELFWSCFFFNQWTEYKQGFLLVFFQMAKMVTLQFFWNWNWWKVVSKGLSVYAEVSCLLVLFFANQDDFETFLWELYLVKHYIVWQWNFLEMRFQCFQ